MSSLAAVWRSPWLAPLNDVTALNDLLAQANPLWSLDQIKARVIEVRAETADTKTFVLRANRHWPGHAAGQHVVVELEMDGVRRHRTFSLSSAPDGSNIVAITVKHHARGLVTGWMHQQLRPGMVVGLSAPRGEFVLPETLPRKLLLLSAGSGITPMMAMLRQLHVRGQHPDLCLVHVSRSAEDAIFRAELEQMARQWPALRLRFWHSASQGHLDMRGLEALAPDAAERAAFLCGPLTYMRTVLTHWQAQGWVSPQHESFGAPLRLARAPGERLAVRANLSKQMFTAEAGSCLLEQAEAAGLKPKHGCRIGICQSCKCVKRSGAVRNLVTGVVSAEPGEHIQLCISAAVSELSLDI